LVGAFCADSVGGASPLEAVDGGSACARNGKSAQAPMSIAKYCFQGTFFIIRRRRVETLTPVKGRPEWGRPQVRTLRSGQWADLLTQRVLCSVKFNRPADLLKERKRR